MRNITKFLILNAMLAFTLASCQDKEKELQDLRVMQHSNIEGSPELVKGRLKFATLDDFQAFTKAHQDMTPEQLMQMDKDLSFVSHLRLNEEIGLEPPRPVSPSALHCLSFNAQEPKPADPIASDTALISNATKFEIADPLLASALDEDREVQIGSLIFRAGNDYTFFYPVGQPELVTKFYEQLDAGQVKLDDAEMRAIGEMVVVNTKLVTNPTSDTKQNRLGNRSVENALYFDGSHRIENQIWEGNWIIYASSGIKTHATQYARKYIFFNGWVDLTCQNVGATATVTYQQLVSIPGTYPPQYAPVTQTAQILYTSENNAAVAVKRFDWAIAQIGYTNSPGGVQTQVQAILSQMVVKVPDPRVTVGGATQTVRIDRLTSNHTGRWNNRSIGPQQLVW